MGSVLGKTGVAMAKTVTMAKQMRRAVGRFAISMALLSGGWAFNVGASAETLVPLTDVQQVAAGDSHSCALTNNGDVRCWGYNGAGQLGDGTIADRVASVAVSGLSGATAIAAGGTHTCALVVGGEVRCWGANYSGQLGDNSTTGRLTPVAVSGLSGATAIATGENHTCALVAGGDVRCWGYNGAGQLGDGTTVYRVAPVAVSGLSGATAIATGENHSCALVAGGEVRCWGYNGAGQLGDDTITYRPLPVAAIGLTGATSITAGIGHTCALIADGEARCWGDNGSGRLGDGTTILRRTPVIVSGLSGAIAIAAGGRHTCALVAGGAVHCWGYNGHGQLGDNSTTQRLVPVAVSDLFEATGIAAGGLHTCARLSNGEVRCWGFNGAGRLGDGTTGQRVVPAVVISALQSQTISFGTAPTLFVGGTGTISATGGDSGNPVLFTSQTLSVCSISDSTVIGLSAGTCTIAASQAGNTNFAPAPEVTQSFAVGKGDQTTLSALASPSAIVFGGSSTLGTIGGSGTGAVSYAVTAGASFCAISGNELSGTGVGTCTVTATKAGDDNYNAATTTVDVIVGKAGQAELIASASPAAIAFGGSSTLGTTGGSGTGAVSYAVTAGASFCAISGTELTGTGVGTCTVTATKAGDDNYNAATATVDVTVGQADQDALSATASPAAIVFGGSSTLGTTGGSGTGAVSYAVTAGASFCAISGTELTGTGVGTCTVTATKAADDNYNAATATVNVTVGKADQDALSATASPAAIAFGGSSTLGTTGGSGTGAVSYAVTAGASFCSISGNELTGTGVGTCTVTATKAGDDNYNAANATVDVTVGQADQDALSATASPAAIVFGGSSTLGTTGGSGTGAVSYAVTAGASFCAISGTELTGTGVGTCTVTATKAADANYNAATATVEVTVFGRDLSGLILSTGALSPSFDPAQLNYTAGVANSVSNVEVTASLQDSQAEMRINGAVASSGVAVTVPLTVGSNSILIEVTAIDSAVRTYTLAVTRREQQLISFPTLADKVLGDADFSVSVSGGASGQPVVLSSATPSVCVVTDFSVHLLTASVCELRANQTGNASFDPADEVIRSFAVQPGADLQISKSNGVEGLLPQAPVVYSIEVGNAGPSAVTGATLVDSLPAELINALWVCTPVQNASCPAASGTGSINVLVDLPVNGILRFDLSAELAAAPGAFVTNSASITVPADTVERDPDSNTASDTDAVLPFGVFANGFEGQSRTIAVPRE